MPIKLLLVDDQMLVREGIKSLLKLSDKVQVVGEASNGSEVLAAISEYNPDVILLDLSMPKMDGLATIQHLNKNKIRIPVLVLTTFDDHDFILKAIQNGAMGYLLKDVSLESLIESIEIVANGKKLVQPALTANLINGLQGYQSDFKAPDNIESLSPKEIEVLGLMASGYSNKEISIALHNSEGTVKNHVSNILSKMCVRDRTRAVLAAIEKGILK